LNHTAARSADEELVDWFRLNHLFLEKRVFQNFVFNLLVLDSWEIHSYDLLSVFPINNKGFFWLA
jgi:hypothetical protein